MTLPEEDKQFLNSEYDNQWELLSEDTKTGMVIKNYHLPEKYTPEKSDLMLLIPDNYPGAGIDMFYFSPLVSRQDDKAIESLSEENHFERQWQRWSRHYPWVPGVHCIATHMAYVNNALRYEFIKDK